MSSRQKLFLGRFKLLTLLVLVIGVLALTQGSVRNLVVNGSFAKASDGKGNQPLFANPTSPVFINEILYDIVSTDAGEFVEVAAPAGTNMANYSIVLYNGSGGAVYDTDALTGTTTDQQGGYGTVSVSYPSNGIQNGSPDGIALINTSTNTLVQFLCYEGTFVGVGGLANGVTCTDIGVSQSGSNAAGTSLQLQGTGGSYGEFTWNATSLANTQNAPNTGQTFTAPVATPTPTPSGSPTPTPTPTPTPSPTPTPTPTPTATPAVFISDLAQAEGNSSTTPFTFTVTLLAPEQAAGVTFDVDTVDDTATTADNDYIGFHATGLTIPAGSSSRSFTVQVNGDTTLEPNQTFFVNISNVVGAAVIDGQAVGTILNDEGVGSSSVVISQVYGGGGNSGSTFKNDFIELYNRGSSPVNLSGWSVQFAGATATFQATSPLDGSPLTTNLSGIIQPGHYFLIKETAGTTGNPTTDLPPADVTGNIAVGSTAGKVALVNNTTVLSGTCPSFAANGIVDFVGYGAANCAETTPAAVISNTQAAIRKNGGCTDTDHNFNDFETAGGPIPRNSSSPINTCGGDPTQLGAVGTSNPTSVDPGQGVLLMVTVTTATSPPSTGVSVSGDLSTMGGSASQQFYDDGTHGDTVAGNNVYSFLATVDPVTPTGVKNIPVTVTDAQARIAFAGIAVSVASPTCGAERWSIKVGTDAEANQVNLNSATPVTVADMRGWAAPSPSPPPTRVAPYEKTVWVIHGTLINYKKEDDVDYHIVMQDGAGNTVITEVPCPCCAIGSPFEPRIAGARQTFDARLTAQTFFQNPNIPVRITGVGFFDFVHGQTGVAPNGIEIHSILDIAFPTIQNGSTAAGANVATQAGDVNIVFGNVSSPGTTTSTPIDPSSAGPAPGGGYKLVGPAFDVSTTAATSAPYNVCINVPYITDAAAFANLKLLHKEGGVLVDRTTGQNFGSKLICGSAPSLSPFVVALGATPTAANGAVSGTLTDDRGWAVAGAVVTLTGSQNRKTITDARGRYQFEEVAPGGFYVVTPSRANYSFSPANRSFSLLGSHTEAEFTASFKADDANPLDTPEFFVRQQYLDVLGREPDEGGFNYWSNELSLCGSDAVCIDRRRRDIAAAFFIEDEFQDTGSFIYDTYKAALGRRPVFVEYLGDRRKVVGGPTLETQKAAFANAFVVRPDFVARYQTQTTDQSFVDAILATVGPASGIDLSSQRPALINAYHTGANLNESRSRVLQELASNAELKKVEYNAAFVLTEYFSYLQRNPEPEGYDFWLNVLNNGDVGNYRGMVCSFITSTEYQKRFSSVVSHSNAECGN